MMQKASTFFSNNRRFIPLSATIVLVIISYIVGAILYEGMRDPQVFLNLFLSNPYLLISAVGMTFVILTGGIDLSVSGVVALVTVASAALLRDGMNAWLVIFLMLLMGMTMGAVMGSFITFLKVQPFIATLAGMWFGKGMCFFISDDAIPIYDRTFRILGLTKILIPGLSDPDARKGAFITFLLLIAGAVWLGAIFIAHFTRFGRTVYAIGGNEQSAKLMGLRANRTKLLVYTFSGFCSGLAGIVYAIYVASGHGLYAQSYELDVIASVVMGGTMLTGGTGYVFGSMFGVLILSLTQTLIQFNGTLSSWWTRIVIGLLTLMFIGIQSLLTSRKAGRRGQRKAGIPLSPAVIRQRRVYLFSAIGLGVIVIAFLAYSFIFSASTMNNAGTASPGSSACELKPYRQDQASLLAQEGAVVVLERNGGPECIDEVFAIFPDGRIIGDNGIEKNEKQISLAEVDQMLQRITDRGWFTDRLYDTWHTPCGQCYVYFITVSQDGVEKIVQAVDGGTDAPADYWQVVSIINGVIPHFESAP